VAYRFRAAILVVSAVIAALVAALAMPTSRGFVVSHQNMPNISASKPENPVQQQAARQETAQGRIRRTEITGAKRTKQGRFQTRDKLNDTTIIDEKPLLRPTIEPSSDPQTPGSLQPSPGAPMPVQAEETNQIASSYDVVDLHKLWDILLFSDPQPGCITEEMLGLDIKAPAVHNVFCKADPGLVGARGIGVECYVHQKSRSKYCAIHSPVIDRNSKTLSDPFVVSRCKMDATKTTLNGGHALFAHRSDTATPTLTAAELANPGSAADVEWLLTIERDCGPPRNNPFHCTSDIVSSFLTLRSAGADPKRTRIVFMDKQLIGPYEMMWRSIAGAGVHSNAEWHQLLQSSSFVMPRFVAHLMPMKPPMGPMWHNFWAISDCAVVSPLFFEFHGLVVSRVLGVSPADSLRTVRSRFTDKCRLWPGADTTRGVNVTIAARRPAKRYQGQAMQRQLANEPQLTKALVEQLPAGTAVSTVDFGELSWPEQLALARSTTVLLGMHGAGLTWSMFLEPGGGLVELHQFLGKAAPPKGLSNIATHAGLTYIRWIAGSEHVADNKATIADINAVVGAVKRVISESQRFCGVISELVSEVGGWDVLLSGNLPSTLQLEAAPRWQPYRQFHPQKPI
jgi:hypothetical protein